MTYHGPGQLIGYPIFDLRSLESDSGGPLGPGGFRPPMEEALIRLCAVYGVRAGRIAGLTGVWCGLASESDSPQMPPAAGPRKIGAIGIHVSRGVTSHGFAFNVATDLSYFRLINPCGITDKPVTSLACEVTDPETLPALEQIAHQAARQFENAFRRLSRNWRAWRFCAPLPSAPVHRRRTPPSLCSSTRRDRATRRPAVSALPRLNCAFTGPEAASMPRVRRPSLGE